MTKIITCIALLILSAGFDPAASKDFSTSENRYYAERPVGKYTLSERELSNNLKVPVLLYHHILSDSENTSENYNAYVVSLENFEEQMKYLYDNGFYTITSNELYSYLYENKPLPQKSVLIHFDDGYLSNIARAYPVLKKYNLKATVFLITSYLSETTVDFDPKKLLFMSKEAASSNKYKDVFEYASHTHNLHKANEEGKTGLSTAQYDKIIEDLALSLKIVNNDIALAYPLGQYNEGTIAALKASNIKLAFGIKEGYVDKSSNPYELNRFAIYKDSSMEKFQNAVNLKIRIKE